jgi:hypothetical protein
LDAAPLVTSGSSRSRPNRMAQSTASRHDWLLKRSINEHESISLRRSLHSSSSAHYVKS